MAFSIVPFKEKQSFVQGESCSREICLGYTSLARVLTSNFPVSHPSNVVEEDKVEG
jgi:hypothetical protein